MLIIFNHKANLNFEEIKTYEKKLRKYNIVVMPTICYLSLFSKGKYILGSQDISEFNKKEITGEITGKQLKSLNVKYCLVGHSERKIYKKENNETLINKVQSCIDNDIIPLYCIGEIKETKKELKEQIDYLFKKVNNKHIHIVYEPVKNINSDNPNLTDVEKNINYIKKYIKETYKQNINIIYGGGVNENNIKFLKKIKNINGLIISTYALKVENVKKIYEETK